MDPRSHNGSEKVNAKVNKRESKNNNKKFSKKKDKKIKKKKNQKKIKKKSGLTQPGPVPTNPPETKTFQFCKKYSSGELLYKYIAQKQRSGFPIQKKRCF